MKFNKWFLFLIPLIAILAYLSIPSAKPVDETGADVAKIRSDKDENFRNSDESPIKDKATFKGLNYYPFNKEYIVDFVLEKAEKAETVELKMTDGTTEKLIFFGFIQAEFKSFTLKLKLYQHEDGNFFLPFKDKTAPTETYGGGRFLDLPLTNVKNNRLRVDFNLAYNPYCAYNEDFACPIPPAENTLPIRIEAGEKIFN
ncbi:MAG: hypothetical protein RLZZ132_235 [Bacteroidota bacterium]|jgi:uncharacterized protein (DUF1684 family)